MNTWDIYEITSESLQHGVKMRGTLRKFSIEKEFDFLVENASDKENVVRFALKNKKVLVDIEEFLKSIVSNPHVTKVMENVQNPVLSKLKVNLIERY